MPSSDSRDRALVGGFFGLLAGGVAFVLVLVWSLVFGPSPPSTSWRTMLTLHLGYLALYAIGGVLVGLLWPIRRRAPGRWLLWFLSTATGAVTVNSMTSGPLWEWTFPAWRSYALMAVLFTPVFAWDWPRRAPGV